MRTEVGLATDIGDGITQMRLPMTGTPMRHVNSYLIEDDDGPTLVDCGWKADDVLEALRAGLRSRGLTPEAIRRVAITHHHFDHYGLAGTLVRAGVPDLAMHERDWDVAREHLARRQRVAHHREAAAALHRVFDVSVCRMAAGQVIDSCHLDGHVALLLVGSQRD